MWRAIGLAGFTCVLASGCGALGLTDGSLVDQVAATDPNVPFIVVEVHTENGDQQKGKLALTEPMTMQQVLMKSGLNKRFARMDLFLMRPRPDGEGWIRMQSRFAQRKIDPAMDYAVFPGDHLVVKENSATVIDDMLDSKYGRMLNFLSS